MIQVRSQRCGIFLLQVALTVVMAAKGYPGPYAKGTVINGLEDVTTAKVLSFSACATTHTCTYIIKASFMNSEMPRCRSTIAFCVTPFTSFFLFFSTSHSHAC